jgi:hypothetical protein
MEHDHPVTHREFEAGLASVKAELKAEIKTELATQKREITEDLTAVMRQIETNLLTAFHSYAKGQNARLHTMDTVDQELRIRMETLEDRVLTLETRPRL